MKSRGIEFVTEGEVADGGFGNEHELSPRIRKTATTTNLFLELINLRFL